MADSRLGEKILVCHNGEVTETTIGAELERSGSNLDDVVYLNLAAGYGGVRDVPATTMYDALKNESAILSNPILPRVHISSDLIDCIVGLIVASVITIILAFLW